MKLLFTGASGFLGANIKSILDADFEIATIGITDKDNYNVDLASNIPKLDKGFEVVLHAAGKAHTIPKTDYEKKIFFDINLTGTKNLCKGLEYSGIPKALIFISTVAVYGLDAGENISEEYPLKGESPYALSKIEAENFLTEWCSRNNVTLSIIRPSLIAGPNPPGNLGAMIKGIDTGKYFSIAGSKARKSVLMVQDIAYMIPALIERGGIYNVCDNTHPTFRDLEMCISHQLGVRAPLSIPFWVSKLMAIIGDFIGEKAPINSSKLSKITESLTFSNEKAKRELNWQPLNVIENFKIK